MKKLLVCALLLGCGAGDAPRRLDLVATTPDPNCSRVQVCAWIGCLTTEEGWRCVPMGDTAPVGTYEHRRPVPKELAGPVTFAAPAPARWAWVPVVVEDGSLLILRAVW